MRRRTKEPLDESEREKWKRWLKLNIRKIKIMAFSPITLWKIDGERIETVTDFIFLGSKSTADGDCSHEIKRCLLLGRKAMTNLDSIKKQRCHFANKGPSSQSYGFSSSHDQLWELDHKECWEPMLSNWCWRKHLRVPWTARRSNQSILKETDQEYSLERLMLKLQYFGHLMQRAYSLEKTLMLGKVEGRRRGWQTRWLDSITDSIDVSLSKVWGMVKDREAWHAAVHGVSKSWAWQWLKTVSTLEQKYPSIHFKILSKH